MASSLLDGVHPLFVSAPPEILRRHASSQSFDRQSISGPLRFQPRNRHHVWIVAVQMAMDSATPVIQEGNLPNVFTRRHFQAGSPVWTS